MIDSRSSSDHHSGVAFVDRLIESRSFRLLLGSLLVLYLASIGYEWYVEGFLPVGPPR